ncbi:hypothetical protein L249_2558 [Ophiocordyceps polyrhachis-furcata BCC 54312]|uniref:Uncharacterized protein n=1 Tax=Ophiocordyceps polyrhachis-furcata BCC 54312 TaxID=1330021 RepID=A0A367LQG7_9HYPO|nr:hypothetical protein L249_2558 [Ophiocordyceps polyrhachis-furcata BCC 54312]
MPFIRLTKLSFNYRTTTSNLYTRCLFSSTRVITLVARPLQLYLTRNKACLEQSSLTKKLHFPRTIQILFDLIPKVCNIFVDNIPIRGLEIIYNNKEALPRI